MRACKNCHKLTENDVCPVCGGATTQYWSGYLGILDPDKSDIAQKMRLKVAGEYALKVR